MAFVQQAGTSDYGPQDNSAALASGASFLPVSGRCVSTGWSGRECRWL